MTPKNMEKIPFSATVFLIVGYFIVFVSVFACIIYCIMLKNPAPLLLLLGVPFVTAPYFAIASIVGNLYKIANQDYKLEINIKTKENKRKKNNQANNEYYEDDYEDIYEEDYEDDYDEEEYEEDYEETVDEEVVDENENK